MIIDCYVLEGLGTLTKLHEEGDLLVGPDFMVKQLDAELLLAALGRLPGDVAVRDVRAQLKLRPDHLRCLAFLGCACFNLDI